MSARGEVAAVHEEGVGDGLQADAAALLVGAGGRGRFGEEVGNQGVCEGV